MANEGQRRSLEREQAPGQGGVEAVRARQTTSPSGTRATRAPLRRTPQARAGTADGVACAPVEPRTVTPGSAALAGWRGTRPPPAPRPVDGRAASTSLAVGAFDGEPAERALPDGQGQRVGRGLQQLGLVGPGQQGPAAALDVQRQFAVDEHHQRAGLAAGLVPGRAPASARRATGPAGQARAAP